MGDYKHCKKCDKFHYDHQECAPVYLVFDDDYMGEEPKEFHATSFEDAAIEYAQWFDAHCDYSLKDDGREVIVEKDGVKKTFIISAEPTIHYSAELKPT